MKPGFKSTEFWLSAAAALVSLLMASGAFGDDSSFAKALGFASAALASLGYSASRAFTKSAEVKAAAEVEKARESSPKS